MPSIPATLRCLRRSAVIAAGLALAACSSSSAPSASTSTSASAAAAHKPMSIAYLSFAVENSYDAPMLAAAQAVASTDGATLKVFDANNSPQTQFSQLQDVINSGQYNGIIVQPIFGTGLTSLVAQAIAKGIKVVNMDQILGPDLSTDQPQVKGLSANVTFVPTEIGTKLGDLVVQACKAKNLNPCKVGYLFDIKASALDVAINGAFQKAVAGSPVKVVAQGQSFFSPTTGLSAVQTMLQAQPGLNLIVGSDQGIEGGAQALASAHLTGKVILVGYGASAAALAGVKSGAWYADVAQAPASEGREAVQAMVKALQNRVEVLELADEVTILRDGRLVQTVPAAGQTEDSLLSAMLGRSLDATFPPKRPVPADAPVALSVRGLTAPGVNDVSFDLRAGEILGLAGLVGAGRTELARAVYRANRAGAGTVRAAGQAGPAAQPAKLAPPASRPSWPRRRSGQAGPAAQRAKLAPRRSRPSWPRRRSRPSWHGQRDRHAAHRDAGRPGDDPRVAQRAGSAARPLHLGERHPVQPGPAQPRRDGPAAARAPCRARHAGQGRRPRRWPCRGRERAVRR